MIDELRKGDTSAFQEVYNQCGLEVCSYFRKKTECADDVQDLMQTTFLKLWLVYATQKRETINRAISTITTKNFNSGQLNDLITLISGKVMGLSLSNTGRSDLDAGADFSVCGPATATCYDAGSLVVIDGVPGGNLQTMAPGEIACIDVLKDGSAASVYDSRATAGVIVTAKRGRAGAVKVNYTGYITT